MKQLSHLQVHEMPLGTGHVVRHMHASYQHPMAEHKFPTMAAEIHLPAGHVLQHIAEHMGIPHKVTAAEAADAQHATEEERTAEEE
jgi:hypothetical protein